MEMKCHHCGHVWDYKGNSEYWVTCSRCLRKIKAIKKEDVKSKRKD